MPRLIDANALIAEYDRVHIGEPGKARKLMEDAPTVDAVEVVHGRWNMDEEMYAWNCSVCRSISLNGRRYSYCHNCGAKMAGDGNA